MADKQHASQSGIRPVYGLAIVAPAVLVGLLLLGSTTFGSVAERAYENIASAVGMTLEVPKNEFNSLASALEERDAQLDEREQAIEARDRAIREIVLEENAKRNKLTIIVLTAITFLLLLLIGVNFYIDFRRGQKEKTARDVVRSGPHAHEGEFTTQL